MGLDILGTTHGIRPFGIRHSGNNPSSIYSPTYHLTVHSILLLATCCIAFDAVHCHFAHLNVLDFASCLNHSSIINLPDEELLAVLHAHTQAVCIRNFAPSPTFQKHSELATYFTTYLHTCFNGHPQGQLLYVHFPTEYQINPLTKHMYHGYVASSTDMINGG